MVKPRAFYSVIISVFRIATLGNDKKKEILVRKLACTRARVCIVLTLKFQYNEISDFQSDGTGLIRYSTLDLCLDPKQQQVKT